MTPLRQSAIWIPAHAAAATFPIRPASSTGVALAAKAPVLFVAWITGLLAVAAVAFLYRPVSRRFRAELRDSPCEVTE